MIPKIKISSSVFFIFIGATLLSLAAEPKDMDIQMWFSNINMDCKFFELNVATAIFFSQSSNYILGWCFKNSS